MRSTIAFATAAGALITAQLSGCVAYPAGPSAYAPAPAYAPAVNAQITIGWHGDRYWDGRRYWQHDEWVARHPEDRGHHDHPDEHDHHDHQDWQ